MFECYIYATNLEEILLILYGAIMIQCQMVRDLESPLLHSHDNKLHRLTKINILFESRPFRKKGHSLFIFSCGEDCGQMIKHKGP